MSADTKIYVPRVINRVEPIVPNPVLGEFKCTGEGHGPPDLNYPTVKACGSTVELTVDCVYREISQMRNVDKLTFTCPVCGWETTIDDEVKGDYPWSFFPTKEEFLRKKILQKWNQENKNWNHDDLKKAIDKAMLPVPRLN